MNVVDKVDLAWAAGMLDADGSISLQGSAGAWRKPIVVVDNTDREIIDELTSLFGGGVVTKKKAQEHHRQCWSWRLYGANNIREFLSLVLPFMRCEFKRQRAQMLIVDYPNVTPRNGRYSPELAAAKRNFEATFLALGEGRGSNAIPGSQTGGGPARS